MTSRQETSGSKGLVVAVVALSAALVALVALIAFLVFSTQQNSSRRSEGTSSTPVLTVSDIPLSQSSAQNATKIAINFAGDCTLGTDENFDQSTSFNAYYKSEGPDYFFAGVKDIFEKDDLTVVNCEGVLTTATTREDKEYAYKGDPAYADIFKRSGIEATAISNNHIYDYGWGSREDTIEALESAGLVVFGDDILGFTEVKGVKVALIAGNMLTLGLGAESYVLPLIDEAKNEGAAIIIVDMHWGEMSEYVPTTDQVTLAHDCIDAGATVVVGSHQHVLQGYEKYNGRYIVYGLGNFCYGGSRGLFDPDCYIFQQTFTVEGGQVKADDDVKCIPCLISSDREVNNYQPVTVDGEEKARVEGKIADSSASIPSVV